MTILSFWTQSVRARAPERPESIDLDELLVFNADPVGSNDPLRARPANEIGRLAGIKPRLDRFIRLFATFAQQ